MRILCYYIFVFALVLIGQSYSQEELPIGARPMGMSGAFTAIADDANAVMWNPAGIAQLSQQELTTMWTNLYNSGVIEGYLGYVLPITNKVALGAAWTSIQFDDGELAYGKHRIHFAGAYSIVDWLKCGVSVKYLLSSTDLDGISEGGTRIADGDIGVVLRPLFMDSRLDKLQLAFSLRNAANTWLTHIYEDRLTHEKLSAREGLIGLAYETPLPNLTISAETDVRFADRFSIGGEYYLRNLPGDVETSIRGGLQKFWNTGERPSFALGASLGIPVTTYAKVFLDYAFQDMPLLPETHRFALRIPFDFNPTLVDIGEVKIPEPGYFYSSLIDYDRGDGVKTHLATVSLSNKHDKDLTVTVKLTIPGYVEEVVASGIHLTKVEDERDVEHLPPEEVKILAGLPMSIIDLKNSKDLPATIEVDYEGVRRYKTAKQSFSVTFRKPGYIPTSEGVGALAAFIHPDDPVVKEFAQNIVAQCGEAGLPPGTSEGVKDKWRPLVNTMQIYESIREFGLRYVPDAEIPYNRRNELGIDDVKYPRYFLGSREKSGDCDDMSVLIATLCESVGISTALADVPGHVFVLVSTGLYAAEGKYAGQIGTLNLSEGKFVSIHGTGDPYMDGYLAIPIDPLQKQDDTFIQAWENGLKTYERYIRSDSVKIVSVRQKHEEYSPAYPPTEPRQRPKLEDFGPIIRRIENDVQHITQWQQEN
jgi:hypothetical protein